LKSKAQFDAERPGKAFGGHLKRRDEADARLERDNQQVDQLRKLVVDCVRPLTRAPV